jgi:putative aldouronate transport system permease protein
MITEEKKSMANPGSGSLPVGRNKKKKPMLKHLRKHKVLLLMLLPGVVSFAGQ